ncbi:MAG TPA: T9SS type A sorting domain-containing protein [Chitinophagales bacterium]|nr:T9SS type A sorting domain-containing protein [Chitinophagales bacterium]
MAIPLFLEAQSSGDYRTHGFVTLLSATNWQIFNGSTWVFASVPPKGLIASANKVTIDSTYSCTVDTDATWGSLEILAPPFNGTTTLVISAFTLTIIGDIELTGGSSASRKSKLTFSNSSGILDLSGNIIIGNNGTAGTALLDMSNASNYASLLRIKGTLTKNSDGVFTAGNNSTVDFNSSSSQTIAALTYANLTTSVNGFKSLSGATTVSSVLNVIGSSTLDLGTNSLTLTGNGTPLVVLGSLNAGSSTVNFHGTSNQNIPTLTFYNLTTDNTGGVTLTGDILINNDLNLVNGRLDIGTRILTLGNNAFFANVTFNNSRMIVANGGGWVRKMATSSTQASLLFPIGDNSPKYSPITLTFSGGTYNDSVSVKVTNAKHPNNANTIHYLKRYWTVHCGYSGFSCDLVAKYNDPADIFGTEANLLMGKWDGATPWTEFSSSINTSQNTLAAAGITSFSDFTGIDGASPSVSITATPGPTVCQSTLLTLTANVTADPSSPIEYLWDTGDDTSFIQPPSNNIGTATYNVTVTDVNGLTASSAITITVSPLPTASISGDTAVCQGAQQPLITFIGDNGTAPYTFTYDLNGNTYSINSNNGPNPVNKALPVNTSTPDTFVFTLLNVEDALGCQQFYGEYYATVVVNPLPSVEIAANPNLIVCKGDTVHLLANPAGGTLPYNYLWSTFETVDAITVNTSDTFSVEVTDLNNCSNSDSVFVTVNDTPHIQIVSNYPDVICSEAQTSIDLQTDNSNAFYVWTRSINPYIAGASSGTVTYGWGKIDTMLTNSFCDELPTTFTIYALLGACKSYDDTTTVTVRPRPEISFLDTSPYPFCNESSTVITLDAIYNGSCQNDSIFWWRVDNPYIQSQINSDTINSFQTIIAQQLTNISNTDQSGTFRFYSFLNGCYSDTLDTTIIVHPITIVINLSAESSLCSEDTFHFAFSDTVVNSYHKWTRMNSELTGELMDSFLSANVTSFELSLVNGESIPLYDTIIVYSYYSDTCEGISDTIIITVKPIPHLTVTPMDTIVCDGQPVTLNLTSTISLNPNDFSWTSSGTGSAYPPLGDSSFNGGSFFLAFDSLINVFPKDIADNIVITIGMSSLECADSSDTVNIHVQVNPIPVLDPIPQLTICSHDSTSAINFYNYVNTVAANTTFNYSVSASDPENVFPDSNGIAIPFTSGFGVTSIPSQKIINLTLTPQTVTYSIVPVFIDNSSCAGETIYYVITVNPLPDHTSLILPEENNICQNFGGQYFSVSNPTAIHFDWDADLSLPYQLGSQVNDDNHNALIFFNQIAQGEVTIFVTAENSYSCKRTDCLPYHIEHTDNSGSDPISPSVVLQTDAVNHILSCFNSDVNTVGFDHAYLWGTYDKEHLNEGSDANQYNQIWIVGNTFNSDSLIYWVLTNKDGCQSRSFYDPPDAAALPHTVAEASCTIDPPPLIIFVQDISDKSDVYTYLFPNPNMGLFTLKVNLDDSRETTILLYDILGKCYYGNSFSSARLQNGVQLSLSLEKGIYFMRAVSENGKSVVTKFIVQ